MRGGFERHSGEGVVEVRLAEPGVRVPGVGGALREPGQGLFVAGGEEHEGVRLGVPTGGDGGVLEREVERSVRGLDGLVTGGEVGSGDDVEAGYLVLAHGNDDTPVVAGRQPATILASARYVC